MRKTIVCLGAVACLAAPVAVSAQAGPSPSDSATASASIVRPISVGCSDMDFGQLAPLQTAGSNVTLPPDGGGLVDPDNVVVPGSRTIASPSNCTALGELGLAFTVTLPTPTTLTSNGNSMVLDTFTISNELDGFPLDRVLATPLAGQGSNAFGVGATLHVGAAQPAGLYTGSFTVSVQYN